MLASAFTRPQPGCFNIERKGAIMSASQTMRFIAIDRPGEPEVMHIAEGPIPKMGPGDVLIRVHAAGINRADLSQRAGKYPPPPDASPILGLEVAGEIAAAGEAVTQWNVGGKVCSLTHGGGYAEYVAVDASHCLPVPQNFSMVDAAALPEAAMTVWSNIFDRAHLQPGETLLVHGGTSGVGSFAIQYAVAFGNPVFSTAGGEAKCAAVRQLGALAIDYHSADFVGAVLDTTQGRGADVILDIVGGDYTLRNLQALAKDGRIAQVAWQDSNMAQIDLALMARKRATLTGSHLRPRTTEDKAAIVAALRAKVWPLYESGRIWPLIHAVFPLEQAAAAHREMAAGRHIGKIVLAVKPVVG
jgi:NADPH2:quinone reductase